jgi:hypothetical protein
MMAGKTHRATLLLNIVAQNLPPSRWARQQSQSAAKEDLNDC